MTNTLIVYHYFQGPPRVTNLEHLYSFKKYSSGRCFYLNVAARSIPSYVKKFPWDMIIFHTLFLSTRWMREIFIKNMRKIDFLKSSHSVKIALPQDEFINMDLVCDFINDFGITHVFSVAPESEWPIIYRTVDFQKVKFHRVLTGYLDDSAINKVNKITRGMTGERPIDIGYRTHKAAYWLGCHGALKWQVADIFQEKAPQRGLVVDMSTRAADTLLGNSWYRFLLRCKYQIGVEGGASILDWDGTYRNKTEEYLRQHPQAAYEEIERSCFPNVDGSLRLAAISPRHLECCLTKTCQVLIEGDYNGILIPGKHYIELKRDFSNIAEVLDIIARDKLREEITTNAWRDIVESGRFTYKTFVDYVINNSLAGVHPRAQPFWSKIRHSIIYYWMLLDDKLSWLFTISYVVLLNWLSSVLPESMKKQLRRLPILKRK